MRPVLEELPAPVEPAVEARPVVGPEATPHGEVVGAIQHVDRVHLDAADVLREADDPGCGQRAAPRTREMLARQEQRGDGPQRHAHAPAPGRRTFHAPAP